MSTMLRFRKRKRGWGIFFGGGGELDELLGRMEGFFGTVLPTRQNTVTIGIGK